MNKCEHSNVTTITSLALGNPDQEDKVVVWKIIECKDCEMSFFKKYKCRLIELEEINDN
jgi:hypothetical protein